MTVCHSSFFSLSVVVLSIHSVAVSVPVSVCVGDSLSVGSRRQVVTVVSNCSVLLSVTVVQSFGSSVVLCLSSLSLLLFFLLSLLSLSPPPTLSLTLSLGLSPTPLSAPSMSGAAPSQPVGPSGTTPVLESSTVRGLEEKRI